MGRGKSYLFFAIVCWALSDVVKAAHFEVELNISSYSSTLLPEEEYIKIIDSFYQNQLSKVSTLQCPSGTPPIFLKRKSTNITENGMRQTSIQLIDPSAKTASQQKPKKRIRKEIELTQQDASLPVVGKIVLFENPQELDHKGKFHLDLLYVYNDYQGKGIGSQALTSLKDLAQELAHKSSFYETITLLSQDVDYKGKSLATVPRRVKFYMDNGFSLHEKSIELIHFLCIKHFIDHFDNIQFEDYIKTYILPKCAHSYAPMITDALLPILQASPKFQPTPFATLLHYVQTDGSICSAHILDRAFYWGGTMSDEEQASFSSYVYLMHHHVLTSNVDALDAILPQKDLPAQEFLQEKIEWKGFPLLPDQNRLNKEIFNLMLNSENYPKIDGERFVQMLRQAQIHSEKKNQARSCKEKINTPAGINYL